MDLKPFFDSLYDKLILRDFTGKIVPGLILLGVGFYIGAERNFWDYALIRDMSALAVLATLGAAWVTAFALQSCGELVRISCNRHLLEYYPNQFNSYREWYRFHLNNTKDIKDDRRQKIERMVVIKEACGNGTASLLVSSLLYIIHLLTPGAGVKSIDVVGSIPIALLDIFLIGFLLRMHHVHVRRQFELTEVLSEVAASSDAQPLYKFELFKDNANEYRFRFRAPNGEIMLQSEGYMQKQSVFDSIESVKNKAPDANIDDQT